MRLFVACDLPAEVRGRLRSLGESLRTEAPRLRWVRPEGIHLTLRFVGEVDEEIRSRLSETLRRAVPGAAPPFEVAVEGAGYFPDRGRPRVLWVGLREPSGALAGLHARVEEAVRGAGVAPENRPFRPHLTLARFGDERADPRLLAAVGLLSTARHGLFTVEAVHLFQSVLRPSGAAYRLLEEFRL